MARRRTPIELKETLERVRVPSGISDRQGTLTWLNKAGRDQFGDIVGRPFTSIVAPEHVPLVEQQRERKLLGVPVTDYEIDVIRPDGRRQHVELSSVLIKGGDECNAIFGVTLPLPRRSARAVPELTPRLSEVLHRLAEGESTEQIAASLHLSKETVRNHVKRILRALGAHSRLEAVAIAHRDGLVGYDEERDD